ncbi:MAG: polysaccharide deacetylase family protein, partial [Pseudomonadota bacterium]
MKRYLVSVHDVMPETLDRVDGLIEELERHGWPPATLLVVPGRGWQDDGVARLRDYADRGYELAGHGWTHSVPTIRNLRHRLHSVLISRRAAEHCALDALGVETLMRRCRQWFDARSLPAPSLYVPPAWALGPVSPRRLTGAGFRYLETLSGIHDFMTGRTARLPVLGFEADTAFRAAFLRLSNASALRFAPRASAIRLAIHPNDLA